LPFSGVRKWPKLIRHFIYFLKTLNFGRKVNVIYAQDPVSVGLPACLAAKIMHKKFILKIVGDYAWEQWQQKENAKFITPTEFQNKKLDFVTELRRNVERWVARCAQRIIVPSEYLKKIVSMWGVKPEKICVIYNSFDASGVSGKLNLSGFNIVSAGRLVSWKGFDTLIEIMPEILKDIPEAKLTIIGSGPEENNLKFKIKSLKLEDRVFLKGQLLHEELLNYLGGGDLFVLNTGYEGLSHQILEAMAVGTSVITTNVGGNPELIENNESGILVEYNNKEQLKNVILKLYRDENLRNKLIQNAKEKTKDFNKEKMINETTKVLS